MKKHLLHIFFVLLQSGICTIAAQAPVLLRDIFPGAANGFNKSYQPNPIVGFKGKAYFAADDGIHGLELWQSDGTPSGTILLKDINPDSIGSDPRNLTVYNGAVYFTAATKSHGKELWRTDGTEAGTVMVKDIRVGVIGSDIEAISAIGGKLYFGADNSTGANALWQSDGTESGTVFITKFNGRIPRKFVEFNGSFYFVATANTPIDAFCKTDGTAAGTTVIKNIWNMYELISTGSYLLLTQGGAEIQRSDGTFPGTVVIHSKGVSTEFTPYNGKFLFDSWGVPWETDGTAAGTRIIADQVLGTATGADGKTLFKSLLYLNAKEKSGGWGEELYKYDGNAFTMVKDIQTGAKGSNPRFITNVDEFLVFNAEGEGTGAELWKSDGSEEGTKLLADIEPGSAGSDPESFTNIDGNLFFIASTKLTGRELYKIDINTATADLPNFKKIVEVWPNPITNSLNVEGGGDPASIQLTITDLMGRTIFQQQGTEPVDLSAVDSGLYILKVSDGRRVQIEKIVKQ